MSDKESKSAIAIDYGEASIGIAYGRNGFVTPLKNIPAKNAPYALNEIAKIVLHNKVDLIVLGLPLSYDGKETAMSRKARSFAKLVKVRLKKPVEFVDEYGSTQESLQEGIDLGLSKKKRRRTDHLSAAIILKNYFEKNR